MTVNHLKSSSLIMSKSESLFEVFNHLFDLPTFGIILDYLDRREIKIGREQISEFILLLLSNQHHFAYPLNLPNPLSYLKSSILSVPPEADTGLAEQIGRDLSEKRFAQESLKLDSLTLHQEDRIGFKLGDHVIIFRVTIFNQFFVPILTNHEDKEFLRKKQFEVLNNPFRQRRISLRLNEQMDLCMGGVTSSGSLGMIEP